MSTSRAHDHILFLIRTGLQSVCGLPGGPCGDRPRSNGCLSPMGVACLVPPGPGIAARAPLLRPTTWARTVPWRSSHRT